MKRVKVILILYLMIVALQLVINKLQIGELCNIN